MCNRVPCNEALSDNPYVLVENSLLGPTVGALGLLNAACLALGGFAVTCKFSEPDETGKRKVVGFTQYTGELKGAGEEIKMQ